MDERRRRQRRSLRRRYCAACAAQRVADRPRSSSRPDCRMDHISRCQILPQSIENGSSAESVAWVMQCQCFTLLVHCSGAGSAPIVIFVDGATEARDSPPLPAEIPPVSSSPPPRPCPDSSRFCEVRTLTRRQKSSTSEVVHCGKAEGFRAVVSTGAQMFRRVGFAMKNRIRRRLARTCFFIPGECKGMGESSAGLSHESC